MIGREPSAKEQLVFETVRSARDAAIDSGRKGLRSGPRDPRIRGRRCRAHVIRDAGFGEFFTHRTGHNIAHELHGSGAHLDNLETHDVRRILPHTCFSVEPGIYLPEFGVRSEINMITRARQSVGHRPEAAGTGADLAAVSVTPGIGPVWGCLDHKIDEISPRFHG